MNALPETNDLEGSVNLDLLESQDFRNSSERPIRTIQSPRTRHRHLQIKQLHEEDETKNLLHSCCGGVSDKRLVILLTQVSVSILVLCFSGAMLAITEEANDKAIYMSLISSTISYWLGKNEHSKD